ncbi:MAG: ABC transporter ATP-binding protein [Thermomicrobiales bacterium]
MSSDLIRVQLQTRIRNHLLSVDISLGNELVALLGREGAGKTEILRSLAGVYTPENGLIEIQGRTVFNPSLAINLPSAERHVGWIPNVSSLFPQQSVAENVRYPFRRGYPMSEHEAERRIDETLQLLSLSERRNRLVRDLDPREQYWVAIARTLVLDPEVLLIDQPFENMGVALQRKLRQDIQRIRRLISVPAIVATTDLEEAYEIADRIGLIHEGQLLQFDPPRTLVTRPVNRMVAELVRSVNVFPGNVLESFDDGVAVGTDMGTLHVSGVNHDIGAVEMVIRPEHIRILGEQDSAPSNDNALFGTVLETTDYGALHTLVFHPDGAPSSRVLEISVSEPLFRQLELKNRGRRTIVLPSHALHVMDMPEDEQPENDAWIPDEADQSESQEPLA